MLVRSRCVYRGVFHNAPTVYPFTKPLHDTPYDQDRGKYDKSKDILKRNAWPAWMDHGVDGTGYGIGLHRAHPLSKLRGNLSRNPREVPRVLAMMIQGIWHKSGAKLYFRGGKPPNPSKHPYLTGEPCPVYGWKVTDPMVIREFNFPHVEREKMRYKPYVALQERNVIGSDVDDPKTNSLKPISQDDRSPKPLVKRLFFWQ